VNARAVTVVGAGVIGLTTGVILADAGYAVRVVTADPIGATASAAAGAMCSGSYLTGSDERIRRWAAIGLARFTALAEQGAGEETGVRLVAGLSVSRRPEFTPPMIATLQPPGSCTLAAPPPGYARAWRYTVPMIDMSRYLPYLRTRLIGAGARIEHRRITALEGLGPVVVNAAGLGARTLADDQCLTAVRGDLVVVRNPGIGEFFDDTDGPALTYIYPHRDAVVLGGTSLPGDEGLDPRPEAAAAIIERCARVRPELHDAEILEHRVGLRPTRTAVRVEPDPRTSGGAKLIHAYGFGGGGVSLSFGVAHQVAELVESCA
jgi:D-amino-acid oxidase